MIRLSIIWFLLLLSLLAVFKAPAYYLWLVSIIVTEFPWIFASITLIVIAWALNANKYRLATVIPGIIAFILFCIPIVKAYGVAAHLKADF